MWRAKPCLDIFMHMPDEKGLGQAFYHHPVAIKGNGDATVTRTTLVQKGSQAAWRSFPDKLTSPLRQMRRSNSRMSRHSHSAGAQKRREELVDWPQSSLICGAFFVTYVGQAGFRRWLLQARDPSDLQKGQPGEPFGAGMQ